jgi:hypothetical protein
MNRLNHTPGPWHTQGCTIYAAGNRIAQTWDTCDDFPTPEMEADARLISAAPQMLLALERLAHPMADDDDLDYAREVIAKAKGQQ